MVLAINPAPPGIMHIDLNSCFAMIEQQANPLLRGRPVAVTNRLVPNAIAIAASYEAKRYGIGVGTRLREARELCPEIIFVETDPPKYIHAHAVFKRIIESYSPRCRMKSIDEAVIDFSGEELSIQEMTRIGYEIKQRFRSELGEWMTCNVGIGTNRFLAKHAASLHKPDGLDVITRDNLRAIFLGGRLTDLCGINRRYEARLGAAGIFTPLEFLDADEELLTRRVFHSIAGHYWYLRLRGWEIDDAPFSRKTIGKHYVLHHRTAEIRELAPVIMKMCEMAGRRLRREGFSAGGFYIGCALQGGGYWYKRGKFRSRLYTTQDLYAKALYLFGFRPSGRVVTVLDLHCYGLESAGHEQPTLFETTAERAKRLTDAADRLNDRYGEFTIHPAVMLGAEHLVPQKIPFGAHTFEPAVDYWPALGSALFA